ncbi:hypothetical protein VNO77_36839 [Canavalia gladiata]|uniref:Formin-like protein n=1 Tax=Canavalia gladiata TaxID=3824 RepID=A0AAN9K7M3_CANGL
MELIRPNYAVVYVILLCALAQGGSEGKRGEDEEFSRDGGALSSSIYIHGIQVENVWKHCRRDMIERNNDIKEFDLHPLERSSDMRSTHSIEKNLDKATKSLPLHMKRKFLDCIRTSTTPPVPVSKEKTTSRYLLTKQFRPTLEGKSGHGRNLLADSPQNKISPSPAAPEESPSPASPEGSPSHAAPEGSPNHAAPEGSPSHGPTPASSPPSPISSPKTGDLPLPPPPPRVPHPPPRKSRPTDSAPVRSSNDDKTQQTIIIAATISGTIILIALAFCCLQVRKNKEDKEDSPLLVLTSSDYSGGSMKVVRLGDADKEESGIEKGKDPSNVRNWSIKGGDNNNASVVEATSSEEGIGVGQEPVPVPAPAAAATATAPAPEPATAPAPAPAPPANVKAAPPPSGPPPPPVAGPPPPPSPLAPNPPPPPPRAGHSPPPPPKPLPGKNQGPLRSKEGGGSSSDSGGDAPKPKLKPFFWDKVCAKPGQSMVWHEINAGSFVINEQMMETLFGFTNQNRNERRKDSSSMDNSVHYIQIIEPKKAQNLSILLRALNVTTAEVVDALNEGNEIPVELIQTLLKMAPTAEEELKLRLFTGELTELGPAERFLKVLVDIPFAFKRLESLKFMLILQEEFASIKDSFATLEIACDELRKSRLFLKLLEAVLKTGNRMNDGTYRGGAQAFRLDTLLKLADVKGTDGKTTLLHFVVQEIIRSEGIRAMRAETASISSSSMKTERDFDVGNEETEEHYRSLGLQVISSVITELEDVKRAALIDGDALTSAVSKLGHSLSKTQEFLNTDLKNLEEESQFRRCIERFMEKAREEVTWLVEEEKRIMALVKSTADFFHGKSGKDEGLRLFLIVRDFLVILAKVCKEVRDTTMKPVKGSSLNKKNSTSSMPSSPNMRQHSPPARLSDLHKKLFPAIAERRVDDSSDDDDDDDDFS